MSEYVQVRCYPQTLKAMRRVLDRYILPTFGGLQDVRIVAESSTANFPAIEAALRDYGRPDPAARPSILLMAQSTLGVGIRH